MANMYHILQLELSLYIFPLIFSLEATKFTSNYNNTASASPCFEIERKALIQFKNSLEDPSGRLSSWIGENCCQWEGFGCSQRTGNVIRLDLRNPYDFESTVEVETFEQSCLGGRINQSLLNLKYLQYLDLSNNNFHGIQIPNFIGSLGNLKYLNLSYMSFSGLVPPSLGNLSNLQYLDLYAYSFINPVSESIWISNANWLSRFHSLKYINLGNINMSMASSNWAQAFSVLSSLVELHLEGCGIHSIPQSLPSMNFTSLSALNLNDNVLNSPIPQWLFNISTLEDLNLRSSKIKGQIPSSALRNLCRLRVLDISHNEISSDIFEFVGGLSKCSNNSLEVLNLRQNNFIGHIPESIGNFRSMRSLYLAENSLSGPVPNSFDSLSFLENLDLSSNKLNGTIPESIGQLKALSRLDLRNNSWEGIISEIHFLTLKNLKYFYLSSPKKSLAFDVRKDWIPPFSLEYFGISDCRVGPTFPAWLKNQKELKYITLTDGAISDIIPGWFWKSSPQIMRLYLYNNQLRGTLPKAISFQNCWKVDLSNNLLEGNIPLWYNCSYLWLSNNKFSGQIPVNIGGEMSTLEVLDLSGNSLNGKIPSSLGKLKNLQVLNLSKNQLSGKFLTRWNSKAAYAIDLSNNNFSGGIPSSICSPPLPFPYYLKLDNNSLSGEVFQSLQNCTGLIMLDLAYNKFTGKIPNWIGERLLSLSSVNLQSNQFYGSIPPNLCHLPYLHILVLAGNNLSGRIPPCLGNLSSSNSFRKYYPLGPHVREYYSRNIDLNVKGAQREYTKILDVVNIIDLSENKLAGEIPEQITNLSYLGTLNLSRNQLTGKIPWNVGDLQVLETLDLSSNHLSGPIPPSMSFMTFLNYLNLSHNNLSGPIPSTNQFNTFNDPSIFEGNPELCGLPLPTNCSTPKDENEVNKDNDHKDDEIEISIWFYTGMALGFVLGFWSVCGTLIAKKPWRHAYFRFVDRMKDRIYVVIAINMTRLSRKLHRER